MAFETRVIALSRTEAQQFQSAQPYVIISLTDTGAQHPDIPQQDTLKDRLSLQFDDIYPDYSSEEHGSGIFCAMQQADAERIAEFVRRWWGDVATIVVHCHAGLSRSTGVAAAIRQHHGQDERDLFEDPRSPNRHCLALVSEALVRAGVRGA